MKKVLTFFLGLTIIVGFTSCGQSEKDINKAVAKEVQEQLSSMGYSVIINDVSMERANGGSFINDILGSGNIIDRMFGSGSVTYEGKCNCIISGRSFSLDVGAVVHQNGKIVPIFSSLQLAYPY